MDSQLIFSKTARGSEEISTRGAKLSLQVRRILIMIDGKRTVTDLAQFARGGEIIDVLSQLESGGFIIRPPAPGPATVSGPATVRRPRTLSSTVTEGGESQRNVITLEEAKRRAVREMLDRIGPAGTDLARRIERSDTPEAFRERVREAERLVASLGGEEAALDYLRALRGR